MPQGEVVSKPPRATRGLSAQQERTHKQITSFLNDKWNYDSKLGGAIVKMCQAIYMPFILFTIVYSACTLNVAQIIQKSFVFNSRGFTFDVIFITCYE